MTLHMNLKLDQVHIQTPDAIHKGCQKCGEITKHNIINTTAAYYTVCDKCGYDENNIRAGAIA